MIFCHIKYQPFLCPLAKEKPQLDNFFCLVQLCKRSTKGGGKEGWALWPCTQHNHFTSSKDNQNVFSPCYHHSESQTAASPPSIAK